MTPKTHQELVERVASIISPRAVENWQRAYGVAIDNGKTPEKARDYADWAASKEHAVKTAAAAISEVHAALLEPSEAMVEAGQWPAEDDGALACWRAMLSRSVLVKEGE